RGQPGLVIRRRGRGLMRALAAAAAVLVAACLGVAAQPPAAGTDRATGIVEMTVSRESGVVSAWLGNGVRLHHREMAAARAGPHGARARPAEPRVVITVVVAGGELHESEPTRGLSAAAAVAWQSPATRTMDGEAMSAHLRERRIRVSGDAMGDALVLRVEAPAAGLGPALRVAASLLTEPLVDPAALAAWAAAHAEKIGKRPMEPRWI